MNALLRALYNIYDLLIEGKMEGRKSKFSLASASSLPMNPFLPPETLHIYFTVGDDESTVVPVSLNAVLFLRSGEDRTHTHTHSCL